MYEYKFARIPLKGFFGKYPSKDYKAIIRAYANQEYRFVQIFAPSTSHRVGHAKYFELIFEKETTE